jgi:ATP-dependent Lon protease
VSESLALDELDRTAAAAFEGYVVKKDLALRFKGQYPVPTYVGEFLIGRYCATTDETEIEEGLAMVQRIMEERAVRAGEQELFKSRARERGNVKILDLVTARLDTKTDSYLVTLPSLQITDVRVDDATVRSNDRMLTGGFYAEVTLEYDASTSHPFGVAQLRPIQMSTSDAVEILAEGRQQFDTAGWKRFLLRSVGLEPDRLSERACDILLLRMVPFVVHNYNLVEIGPRGTGKSHLFQQVSPYAHLVSGGKATVAKMFVNNASGQRGLVCQYDVVCFDEVSGVAFDQRDGVNIMKGYMESGEFSRGRESIRAEGSIVLVGNFDVDVQEQLSQGHLFKPLPPEMRDDTAFMDRVHAYLPGWDVPKLDPTLFTHHFGLVSDFLSECWSRLRQQSRLDTLRNRVEYGIMLSGRDRRAVDLTVDGLLKLVSPDASATIADEDLEWALRLALECRQRVKEQQKRVGKEEFAETNFSIRIGDRDVTVDIPEGVPGGAIAGAKGPPASVPAPEAPSAKGRRAYVAGDTIDGSFEVIAPLGKGGFSSVYRVYRAMDSKEYALKVFNPRDSFDLVKRELDVLRGIDHPNVVKVVWADQTHDGRWYLVTELIDGASLEDAAIDGPLLSIPEVLGIGEELLDALVAIHPDEVRIAELKAKSDEGGLAAGEFEEVLKLEASGMIHRDIKPQNILRKRDGHIVVVDFNIASRAGAPVSTRSGTPPYQAPDVDYTQWDVSADLFATGVTLYEIACQHHPYEDETPTFHGEPRDPRQFRADISGSLARFLMRACAPLRTERFQTAKEMRDALLSIRSMI